MTAIGAKRFIEQEYQRLECERCGEPATQRHTFLLHRARVNPASSAFGKDDISWCSDADVLTCDGCKPETPNGMSWCSTFSAKRFPDMMAAWVEISRREEAPAPRQEEG